jgi:hypothetical protein
MNHIKSRFGQILSLFEAMPKWKCVKPLSRLWRIAIERCRLVIAPIANPTFATGG